MKCPDCNQNLREVCASGHYGMKIKLDQCPNCGGIWFENLELYSVSKKDIERIEKIDLEKLQENSCLGRGNNLCPKCRRGLKIFHDSNLPPQMEIEHCHGCGGVWMNRGETIDFKKWQKKKIERAKSQSKEDRELEESIKKLLDTGRDSNFKTLGRMGKFFSTPMNSWTLRSLKYPKGYSKKEIGKAERVAGTATEILMILLKLFLKH